MDLCEFHAFALKIWNFLFIFWKKILLFNSICNFAPESWQSGRMRRSWKPLSFTGPGVRIPHSPLLPVNVALLCNDDRHFFHLIFIVHFISGYFQSFYYMDRWTIKLAFSNVINRNCCFFDFDNTDKWDGINVRICEIVTSINEPPLSVELILLFIS